MEEIERVPNTFLMEETLTVQSSCIYAVHHQEIAAVNRPLSS